MAQFYFHLHECGTITRDEEGSDLVDYHAAHDQAVRAARSIVCHEAIDGQICMNCFIAVEDANHIELDRVLFSDAVKIIDPN